MPSSYVSEIRRRPPLPSPEVRRPMSIAVDSYSSSGSGVAPYRPPQYSSRAGSLPPPTAAVSVSRSRSSWAPTSAGSTYGSDLSATSSWSQSSTRYQPRSTTAPPLTRSSLTSYSSGSTYRTTPRRPYDPDLDDEDVISKNRTRYVPTSYSPRARYLTGAGQRVAMRQHAQNYFNNLQDDDDYKRTSLNELRARTSQMMDNIDKHKRLIDKFRVGTTTNGPIGPVMSREDVDRKYASIISNYRLDVTPSTYRQGSVSSSASSTTTAPYTPPTKPVGKAEVSDARRKLRKILSESKGNRNYYD